jgi:GNAT superfamily N-acetyltransferase
MDTPAETGSPEITVRPATPADADAIAAVLLAAFREFEPRYSPEAFRATTILPDEVRRRLGEGPAWVAAWDRVVGTVAALEGSDGVYVRGMAVEPRARGQGIGARLLAAVEAHARAGGHGRLHLRTAPFLTAALALYERAGYRRTGVSDFFGTRLLTMEKRLG